MFVTGGNNDRTFVLDVFREEWREFEPLPTKVDTSVDIQLSGNRNWFVLLYFKREKLVCGVVRRRDGAVEILVAGGLNGADGAPTNVVEVFHADSKEWTTGNIRIFREDSAQPTRLSISTVWLRVH